MYLNIISRRKGGGAELLVHELHKIYLEQTLDSHAIYFVGKKIIWRKTKSFSEEIFAIH